MGGRAKDERAWVGTEKGIGCKNVGQEGGAGGAGGVTRERWQVAWRTCKWYTLGTKRPEVSFKLKCLMLQTHQNRQTDRWTDEWTERQTDREMDRQTDRWMDEWTDRQTDRQTDRWMDGWRE